MINDDDISDFWAKIPEKQIKIMSELANQENWTTDNLPDIAVSIAKLDNKLNAHYPDMGNLCEIPANLKLKMGSQMSFGRALLWLQAQLHCDDESIAKLFDSSNHETKVDRFTLVNRLVIMARYEVLKRLFDKERLEKLAGALSSNTTANRD